MAASLAVFARFFLNR